MLNLPIKNKIKERLQQTLNIIVVDYIARI